MLGIHWSKTNPKGEHQNSPCVAPEVHVMAYSKRNLKGCVDMPYIANSVASTFPIQCFQWTQGGVLPHALHSWGFSCYGFISGIFLGTSSFTRFTCFSHCMSHHSPMWAVLHLQLPLCRGLHKVHMDFLYLLSFFWLGFTFSCLKGSFGCRWLHADDCMLSLKLMMW